MNSNSENEILVSICCLAYNHNPYIRQCIDGFLMQKVNFPIEILIHDDASTDKTADIIREYEARYPSIIKPIYQKENQYSKGVKVSLKYLYSRAKGKYIALCEGDDYWTDPLKLQKQVDFLETHSDYSMCSHLCQIFKQETGEFGILYPSNVVSDLTYDLDLFIKRERWLTQTLTIVYRRNAFNADIYAQYTDIKDLTLYYHILKSGKGYFINENMGVYRNHEGGIWTKASNIEKNTSDLKTYLGIYKVERNEVAAKALLIRFNEMAYVGIPFLINNYKIYIHVIRIINHYFGTITAINSVMKSLNIFKALFYRIGLHFKHT